jgi:hypothetical protein
MVAANKEATELRLPSGKFEVITSNVFVTVAHVCVCLSILNYVAHVLESSVFRLGTIYTIQFTDKIIS